MLWKPPTCTNVLLRIQLPTGPRRCRASGKAPLGGGPGGKVADTHVLIFPGNRVVDNARLFWARESGDGTRSEAAFSWPRLPAAACLQASHVLSESLIRKGGWCFELHQRDKVTVSYGGPRGFFNDLTKESQGSERTDLLGLPTSAHLFQLSSRNHLRWMTQPPPRI